jgi:CPA2 family monovalent cation:H+ antiporter-2
MTHGGGLIATITLSLVAAFIGGFLARGLRLPTLVGYLLAGIAVGPFTPGFVGNAGIAAELAEIGVVLLMFGVGLHFSLRDLLAVREIAVPGAVGQIAVATLLGAGLALAWGWSLGAGLVFGLALSVASTVVLLRALVDRDALETIHGRVAVGWLILEDLFTVLVLVLLPAIAVLFGAQTQAGLAASVGGGRVFATLGLALGKTVLFVVLMIFVGARALPWLLQQVARTNSRELFTLAVLAVALGVAYGSAALFGVSLALGAFLAGMVLSESDMSHQAAADALPMRDAFAVLFFVSAGMLFNPAFLLANPGQVAAVLAIILLGKSVAGLLLVAALGYPLRTGLTVAAGLSQIGEFSFIVAGLGRTLGLLPENGYQLIVAGALLSITLNPVMFRLIGPLENWLRRHPRLSNLLEPRGSVPERMQPGPAGSDLRDHAVICGYGRVGRVIGQLLERRGCPYMVIDQDRRLVEKLRECGTPALYGDAGNPALLTHAHLAEARVLVIAIPDARATRQIAEFARRTNPHLDVIARTHSEREWRHLRDQVNRVVVGEREAALEMARCTLRRFGASDTEIEETVRELRELVEMERPSEPVHAGRGQT